MSVGLGQGDLIVPECLQQCPDGIFIDTVSLPSAEELERAVDHVFSSGFYFSGLDYDLFQRLLYDFDPIRSVDRFRLASEIREFSPARRSLYRSVKFVGSDAHYMFEPVMLESTVDEPVFEPGKDGGQPAVGSERRVIAENASLDLDEFVADLWIKGVRFGIDIPKVKAVIEDGRSERVVVARERAPAAGRDAGIEEQSDELHRDNTPRELANGKVDLGQFKNRFPQLKEGTLLLMKTPVEPGVPGRTVAGKRVEPPQPKDFDLASLAGEGTRIEKRGDRDYIVAAIDGFLNLDSKTNCISITEKIVNRDGVNARTTGNLALTGDEYEEYGEVQEGRMVEGKGLTFHANVFGKVLSSGGDIVLMQNLVGGTAQNRSGSITVSGLASNAVVQTAHGVLRIKRAENSILIGDRIEAEWLSNCTVLAEEVDIVLAEGCAIAGKRIHVGTGRERSGDETLISMLLPDLSSFDRALEKERSYIAECEELMAGLKCGIESVTSQPDVQKYFAIAGKIHRKEITLTPEQQGPWQQMRARLDSTLKRLARGREDIKALEGEIAGCQERIADLEGDREQAMGGLECSIEHINSDLVVRTLTLPTDAPPLHRMAPRELKVRLRSPDPGSRSLFAGSEGEFSWKPE